MKSIFLILIFFSTHIFGQDTTRTIQMISDRSSDNEELQDFFPLKESIITSLNLLIKILRIKNFILR
ncbi:MAG: hypothetical protein AB8H03_22925 [Saprospiraceae bacterium]